MNEEEETQLYSLEEVQHVMRVVVSDFCVKDCLQTSESIDVKHAVHDFDNTLSESLALAIFEELQNQSDCD